MKEGKMVPSRVVVEGLKSKVLSAGNKQIIMIDGFPRNQENMDLWTQIVGDSIQVKLLLYV